VNNKLKNRLQITEEFLVQTIKNSEILKEKGQFAACF
jgi:hypothetical protein